MSAGNDMSPDYVGHWLHGSPRFRFRVWYPILLRADGGADLIDVFSLLSTTKHDEPGCKKSAMCLRNALLKKDGMRNPEAAKFFGRLISEFTIPVVLSARSKKLILRLNRDHLDGWEYDADDCIPCDRLLEKELLPQLRGKLLTDPASIFSSE